MLVRLSTAHPIGLAGDACNHTVVVTALETTAVIAVVATALFFLPRYLRVSVSTIPECLAAGHDKTSGVIEAAAFVLS